MAENRDRLVRGSPNKQAMEHWAAIMEHHAALQYKEDGMSNLGEEGHIEHSMSVPSSL